MNLRMRLKTSLLGDRLIRRTPGLYGRYRVLIASTEGASPEERLALCDRLTARSLAQAAQTAFARARGLVFDFESWPILEKDTLRDEAHLLNRSVLLPVNRAETGGTTGIPISVRRSWQSVVFEQAAIDHLVERHGGVSGRAARVAVLRGDTIKDPSDMTPPFWRLQHGGRHLAMSANHLNAATAASYLAAIRDFKPDMLWVYPTALEALCRLASLESVRIPSLRLVLSSSEVLTAQAYADSTRFFGVPVLDYYGQAERVCLSWSADGVRHHFMPIYGRVELRHAYDDGEDALYEIIGTSYWNAAQPLVRYATGDLARLPKGLSAAEIEAITLGLRPFHGVAGRQSDYLISAEGGHLMGIDHIPRGVPDVAQMQFHQHSPHYVEIHVVPLSGYSDATKDLIVAKARQKIPESMHIDLVTVHSLQRTAWGKASLVVRSFSE